MHPCRVWGNTATWLSVRVPSRAAQRAAGATPGAQHMTEIIRSQKPDVKSNQVAIFAMVLYWLVRCLFALVRSNATQRKGAPGQHTTHDVTAVRLLTWLPSLAAVASLLKVKTTNRVDSVPRTRGGAKTLLQRRRAAYQSARRAVDWADQRRTMRYIRAPQRAQVPCRAGRPFFRVVSDTASIGLFCLHLTQYASRAGSDLAAN